MAKGKSKQLPPGVILADGEPLDLGNRYLAAVLAWVIPGAGHFYQKRYLKSAIFSVAIFSTFLIGMIVSGSRCVYASWNGTEKTLAICSSIGQWFCCDTCGDPSVLEEQRYKASVWQIHDCSENNGRARQLARKNGVWF